MIDWKDPSVRSRTLSTLLASVLLDVPVVLIAKAAGISEERALEVSVGADDPKIEEIVPIVRLAKVVAAEMESHLETARPILSDRTYEDEIPSIRKIIH